MQLRCHLPISTGTREGRILVRLVRSEPSIFELVAARDINDATHQLVSTCGMPILTHLSERDTVVSREIEHCRLWEFAESSLLLHLARPGATFVDVGANVGYYSVLLSMSLGSTGQIFSFEPEPKNYEVLVANLLLTKLAFPSSAPTIALGQALGDRIGEEPLYTFQTNSGMHSLAYRLKNSERSVNVRMATLDQLRFPSYEQPLIGRKIDIIKADIQGAERRFIQGARQVLERDRPILCLEFEPHFSGQNECSALLADLAVHAYTQYRLFHANARDPYQVLTEFGQPLTAADIHDLVSRQAIGPYGTLLAYP